MNRGLVLLRLLSSIAGAVHSFAEATAAKRGPTGLPDSPGCPLGGAERQVEPRSTVQIGIVSSAREVFYSARGIRINHSDALRTVAVLARQGGPCTRCCLPQLP